jgi:hypothetical protein
MMMIVNVNQSNTNQDTTAVLETTKTEAETLWFFKIIVRNELGVSPV